MTASTDSVQRASGQVTIRRSTALRRTAPARLPEEPEDPFASFEPGSRLVLKPEWTRTARPRCETVSVVAPGRLHFSVFDYTRMSPTRPGGGGIGISTDTYRNAVDIHAGAPPPAGKAVPPAAKHVLRLFRTLVRCREDLHVAVEERIPHVHSGYGSNVTMLTSVFWGLNRLMGCPFNRREALEILTVNYVESTDDRRVHRGFDTGVGQACLLFGGFVLMDERCRFVGSVAVPGLFAVIAKGRMESLALEDYLTRGLADRGETGAVEAQINQEVGMRHQRRHGAELLSFLNGRLVPAFRRRDAQSLLRNLWTLNELGTFKRMQLSYKAEVMRAFERVAKSFLSVYCGISSAGPSMFALVPSLDAALGLKTAIEATFSDYFESVRVGMAGKRMQVLMDPSRNGGQRERSR